MTLGELEAKVADLERQLAELRLQLAARESQVILQAAQIGNLHDECNRLRNGGPTSIGADLARRSGRRRLRR